MDSKKIERLVKYARLIDARRFLLLSKNGNVMSLHIEKMHPKEGINACVAGFVQMVAMDIEKGGYGEEYAKVAQEMVQEFQTMVKKYNAKFTQVIESQPQPKK